MGDFWGPEIRQISGLKNLMPQTGGNLPVCGIKFLGPRICRIPDSGDSGPGFWIQDPGPGSWDLVQFPDPRPTRSSAISEFFTIEDDRKIGRSIAGAEEGLGRNGLVQTQIPRPGRHGSDRLPGVNLGPIIRP